MSSMATPTKHEPTLGLKEMPEEVELNFPIQPDKLKGLPAEERLRIWARQSKLKVIHLCNVKSKDGTKRCYYPLVATRDPARENIPITKVDAKGKKYVEGRCSYDGKGHGIQPMYPPTKEDELDP